ncbi:MAG: alpha/beta hydrolase fold domain-containing protein [Hydrotalea flava]|uniref:alpha/beta hydrolase n=1 Tax=Hydrotalea TaxID=1004300 RepID=UPI000941CAAF|nr:MULTISPECIES: alpha/beta hydrolase [Hydrotalea]MBY0347274.1 alpha/beta hydrolase [Hydrotalea flava]NIM36376.1 alpha/beta hydrolase fold domain-containing protein [Hydrotalea flava]NIM39234.1 alpha/beta hydrolase fold domain-containing protein [Hydrotalea flava]NIN04470.1 alpha/beta hydrolase fold domain-containing protein [Hydrotalea flava]NIN16095.1 alpha/beta hydrolase fold domain-containing protein [Hydrotalea flava]
MLSAQQRIYLYNNNETGIVNNGFDSVRPYMEYYRAIGSGSAKTAILICPGGAYTHLAWEKEGVLPAHFFNTHGIDVFVLHYRLNNEAQQGHRYPAQYNDANKALHYIDEHAATFGIRKDRIGVMGFSAGGHLAATISTLNPMNANTITPAFSILVYPVITMESPFVHAYSRKMLLGEHPAAQALMDSLSAEKNITAKTPPAILFHANDDTSVPVQNSLMYYEQLHAHHVRASLFIYDHGGHGFGMAQQDPWLNQWPNQVMGWLQALHFD